MRDAIRILYIDDNPHDRELVRDALEKEHGGFAVTEAASRGSFERLLDAGEYDLVLSDFNILGFQGLQVLDAVLLRRPTLPVVIVTGTGSEEVAVEAMKRGAADYVIKSPKHIKKLPTTIHTAIEQQRTREERDRLFNYSLDLLAISGFDGYFKQINPAWEKTLGWTNKELMSKPSIEFVHPDDRDSTLNALRMIANSMTRHQFENRYRGKDGDYRWLWWNSYSITAEGKVFSVARDITERKRTEELIRASLHEKELLLKEIHHRVKNNLQIISSLLSLQSAEMTDPLIQMAFSETRHRIRAMALVHERLFSSPDLKGIDFAEFLKSLVYQLLGVFNRPEVSPSLEVSPIVLGIDTAIPCGLIVDELVTNSLKYAFPEGRKGSVFLGLRRLNDGMVELVVADNGVGFPPGKDFRSMTSLGISLVTNLAEQIGASIDVHKGEGTKLTFTFRG